MLSPDDLLTLQDYDTQRADIKERTIAIKRNRYVALGEHVSLLFENRDTVFYQVMEMLRIENTTDPDGIGEELEAYNPLIPDGTNFKATMLIQYEDAAERAVQLKYLRGIEDKVWCRVGDSEPVYAHADEDMERSDEEKTSAVHFLRFELDANRVDMVKGGASLEFGSDHPNYTYSSGSLPNRVHNSLRADLA